MFRTPVVGFVAIVLVVASSPLWLPALWPAPSVDEAAARDVVLGELMAYSDESDGQPWVVFDAGMEIVLSRLGVDRSPYPRFPAFPRPRLGTEWHGIDDSAAAFDAGFIDVSDGVLLFGEIGDDQVAHLSIEGAGEPLNVRVRAPGFIVHAPRVDGGLLHLRWLDLGGQVIHESLAHRTE